MEYQQTSKFFQKLQTCFKARTMHQGKPFVEDEACVKAKLNLGEALALRVNLLLKMKLVIKLI